MMCYVGIVENNTDTHLSENSSCKAAFISKAAFAMEE